jgi:hypothetical protein
VKSCFYGALTFKRLETAVADRSRRFAQKLKPAHIEEASNDAHA